MLERLAEGLATRQIAERLSLGRGDGEEQLARIYEKLASTIVCRSLRSPSGGAWCANSVG